MQARILDKDQVRTTSELADVRAALAAKQPLWIDLERQDATADAVLAELPIHPLTVEDIWQTRTFPKLDDYDHYVYAIVHGVAEAKVGALQLTELDIVIGEHFVVSHDPGNLAAKDVADELARSPRLLAKGPAWLAHALLDRAVDKYLPVIDQLDTDVAALETDVLRDAGTRRGPDVLRRILRFKRMLQELRRMGVHQREILLRFSRGEIEEIPRDAVPFFRDVYDHFLRINDLVDSYRDLVTSSLEAYLSVQSNRMNEIMKTLTLIATVMLPITFIAGVYGMNFKHMPELDWAWGYPYALGLMGAVTIACFLWFWRKGWIGSRDLEVPDE
ncbi:MAG: magnesium/cobalt transporter CorA [Acidobacteriota bacterium]